MEENQLDIKKLMEEYAQEVRNGNRDKEDTFCHYINEKYKNSSLAYPNAIMIGSNLSGMYDEDQEEFYEPRFHNMKIQSSDLQGADCFLASFEKTDLQDVKIKSIKKLNPARLYLATNVGKLRPDGDKQAMSVKRKAENLLALTLKVSENEHKKLLPLIDRYKKLYDQISFKENVIEHNCNNKDRLFEAVTALEERLKNIITQGARQSLAPKEFSSIYSLSDKIKNLLKLIEKYQQHSEKRFIIEILVTSLKAAKSLDDNSLKEKIVNLIIGFIINNPSTNNKCDEVKVNLTAFLTFKVEEFIEKINNVLENKINVDITNFASIESHPNIIICKQIADIYKITLQYIINLAIKILGREPNCSYSFISIGSLATGLTTHLSDVNFIILVDKKSSLIQSYFLDLVELVELLVICMGGTPIVRANVVIETFKLSAYTHLTSHGFSINHGSPNNKSSANSIIFTPDELASSFDNLSITSDDEKELLSALLVTDQIVSHDATEELYQRYLTLLHNKIYKRSSCINLLITHMDYQYQNFPCNLDLRKDDMAKRVLMYLRDNVKYAALLSYEDNRLYRATNFVDWTQIISKEIDEDVYKLCNQLFIILIGCCLHYQLQDCTFNRAVTDEIINAANEVIDLNLKKIRLDLDKVGQRGIYLKHNYGQPTGRILMEQTQQETSTVLSLQDIPSRQSSSLVALSSKILGANWQALPFLQAIANNTQTVWSRILGVQDYTTLNPQELVKKDEKGNSGLHLAALASNNEVIQAYAEQGLLDAEPNALGLTPLHIAVIRGNSEGVTILLNHHASAVRSLQLHIPLIDRPITVSALTLAVLLGQIEVIKTIFNELKKQYKLEDAALTTCEPLGHLLHAGVVSCYANSLEFLLTDPAMRGWSSHFIEKTNQDGKTPLAYAAEVGNLDAIEWLVKAGANVSNTNNRYGRTPLHYAVIGKQPLAVHLLIQLDANVHLMSQEPILNKPGLCKSKTPLQLAEKLLSRESENAQLTIIYQRLSNHTVTKAISLDLGTTGQVIHRNLVIQGGGVKGLAYAGALPVLEQKGVLKGLHRVAGTSAGAISALLVALNFSSEKIEQALVQLTVKDMLGESGQRAMEAKQAIKAWLGEIEKNLQESAYLKKGKGMAQAALGSVFHLPEFLSLFRLGVSLPFTTAVSDGEALKQWLMQLVASKLTTDLTYLDWEPNKVALYATNLTFSRLRELVGIGDKLGYKHLYAFASDITAQDIVIFNSENYRWDQINVIDAVCASAALPIAFKPRAIKIPSERDPQRLEDHFFIDGGLIRNRPIEYFDEMSFQNPHMDMRWRFRQRTNRQTLALCLEEGNEPTPDSLAETIGALKREVEKEKIGLGTLVWRIGQIFYQAERLIQSLRQDLLDRCILIYVEDLGTTDFEVIDNPERLQTIKSWGQTTAEKFLEPKPVSTSASTVNQVRQFSGSPVQASSTRAPASTLSPQTIPLSGSITNKPGKEEEEETKEEKKSSSLAPTLNGSIEDMG